MNGLLDHKYYNEPEPSSLSIVYISQNLISIKGFAQYIVNKRMSQNIPHCPRIISNPLAANLLAHEADVIVTVCDIIKLKSEVKTVKPKDLG